MSSWSNSSSEHREVAIRVAGHSVRPSSLVSSIGTLARRGATRRMLGLVRSSATTPRWFRGKQPNTRQHASGLVRVEMANDDQAVALASNLPHQTGPCSVSVPADADQQRETTPTNKH